MIYFFYGTNTEKIRKKVKAIIESKTKQHPDVAILKIDATQITAETIDEIIGSQGLFSSKSIIDMRDVCEVVSVADIVLSRIADIAESSNVFLWSERDIDAKRLKIIEKHSENVEVHQQVASKKETINAFPLADALAQRDKKKAWVLYCSLLQEAVAPEEIHGTLLWQFKMTALAHAHSSAQSAGIKPFVFSKAQQSAKKYSRQEVKNIVSQLMVMYHEAHRGNQDLALSLESFILSV